MVVFWFYRAALEHRVRGVSRGRDVCRRGGCWGGGNKTKIKTNNKKELKIKKNVQNVFLRH